MIFKLTPYINLMISISEVVHIFGLSSENLKNSEVTHRICMKSNSFRPQWKLSFLHQSLLFRKVKIDWTFFSFFAEENFVEPASGGDGSSGHISRHQPSPQILSHDQIFRAQVGETLVLPCQVANLGKDFERKIIFYKQIGRCVAFKNYVMHFSLLFDHLPTYG